MYMYIELYIYIFTILGLAYTVPSDSDQIWEEFAVAFDNI